MTGRPPPGNKKSAPPAEISPRRLCLRLAPSIAQTYILAMKRTNSLDAQLYRGEVVVPRHPSKACPASTPFSLSAIWCLGLALALVGSCCFQNDALGAPPAQPEPLLNLTNPIGDPVIHLQDPFILPAGKAYYLFGVGPSSEGIQCYESPDLLHWKLHGWAWRASGLRVARRDLRSPWVFAYNGMFCLVYSARMPSGTQLALAASVRPEGPYHDLHVPWLALGEGCLDGHVFVDNNRKPFLFFTLKRVANGAETTSIFGVALNPDFTRAVGQPVKLFEPGQAWEYSRGDTNRYVDSPGVFKLGSKYYLTYSANNRETHRRAIGYATADQPLGPWTRSPDNPLLASHPETGLVAPAGGSVFRSLDKKEWFIVYQASSDPDKPASEDLVHIDRMVLQDIRKLAVRASPRRAVGPGGTGP
jgi:beta-xylosidase